MRKFVECKNFSEAFKECPWATDVITVVGGYMCFETETDYEIWKNQK